MSMSRPIYGLLLYMSFVYQASPELNITYIDKQMSWVDAKDYCFNNGGLLESNYTELSRLNGNGVDFWLGKYSDDGWSKWSLSWGCYVLSPNQSERSYIVVKSKIHCQENCSQNNFFAFKDNKCYCFDVLPVGTTELELCRCDSCLSIYKHNIGEFERSLESLDTPEHLLSCLSAKCVGQELKLRSEDCTHGFEGICEINSTSVGYGTQSEMSYLCRTQYNSQLKWYTSNFCRNQNNKVNKLWTRAKREITTYTVIKQDKNKVITPACCQYLSISFDLNIIPDTLMFTTCETRFSFFCRFGFSFDDETTAGTTTSETTTGATVISTTNQGITLIPSYTTTNTGDGVTGNTSTYFTEASSVATTWITDDNKTYISTTEVYLPNSGENSLVTTMGYVSGIILLLVAIAIIVVVLRRRQTFENNKRHMHNHNFENQATRKVSVTGNDKNPPSKNSYVHPDDVYVDVIIDTDDVTDKSDTSSTRNEMRGATTNYKIVIEKTENNTNRYSQNHLYSAEFPIADVIQRNQRASSASHKNKRITVESIYERISDDTSIELREINENNKELSINRKSVEGIYSEVDLDSSSTGADSENRRTMTDPYLLKNMCPTPENDELPTSKSKSTDLSLESDYNYVRLNENLNSTKKPVRLEPGLDLTPRINFTQGQISSSNTTFVASNKTLESQYEHNVSLKSAFNKVISKSKISRKNSKTSETGAKSPYETDFSLRTGYTDTDDVKKQIENKGHGDEATLILAHIDNIEANNNGENISKLEKDTKPFYDQIVPINVVSIETYDTLNDGGKALFTAARDHTYEKTISRNDRQSLYDTTCTGNRSAISSDDQDVINRDDYSKLNLSIRRRKKEQNIDDGESYERLHEGTDRDVTTETSLYDRTASVKAKTVAYDHTNIKLSEQNNKEHFFSDQDYARLNVPVESTKLDSDES